LTGLGFAVPKALARAIVVATTAALVLVGLAAFDPAHASDGNGAISGTVTAPAGAVGDWWTGLKVSAHSVDTGTDFETYPDENGDYLIDDLAPGDYVIVFGPNPFASDGPADYLTVYYPGTHDVAVAVAVTVVADSTTDGIDGYASVGATVAGHVTAPLDEADAGWWRGVTVQVSGPASRTTPIADDGSYSFSQLLPGSYNVSFVVSAYDDGEGGQVEVDLASQDYPSQVGVVDGDRLDSIDAALEFVDVPDAPFTLSPDPQIPSTASFGDTLGVTVGTWDPTPTTFSYQWFRGTTEVGSESTYTVQVADIGEPITVEVTAHKDGYIDTTVTSSAVAPVAATFTGGTASTSGTPSVGETLSASLTDVAPDPTTTSWVWQCNDVAIDGATASTYVVTSADAGCSITAVATFSKEGYADGTATSSASHIPSYFGATPTPTIPSTAVFGDTLSVTLGDWSPAADDFTYQWLRGTTEVGSDSTYTLQPDDVGAAITVKVTAHRAGYVDTTVTSNAVTPVAATFTGGTAWITGTAAFGETLSASLTDVAPDPTSTTWVWQCNDVAIDGATTNTYALTVADAGCAITAVATYSKAGYADGSTTSDAKHVPSVFTAAPNPSIPMTAKFGDDLNVTLGTWSPAPDTTTYQWFRGATEIGVGETYTVQVEDIGQPITVRVTAHRAGYVDTATTSNVVTPIVATFSGGVVTVTGTANEGEAPLSASLAGVTPTPQDVSWQWTCNNNPIPGATDPTHTVTGVTDGGCTLRAVATFSTPGYADGTTASTGVQARVNFLSAGTPQIPTSAVPGDVLTAEEGAWSPTPATFEYQWYRNGIAITDEGNPGQSKTYTVTTQDVGKALTVQVMGYRAFYFPKTSQSSNAVTPTKPPLSAGSPGISGSSVMGQSLTAREGTWAVGVFFKYQWLRDGTPITGATARIYTTVAGDSGHIVSVQITGSLNGFADTTATAPGIEIAPASFTVTTLPSLSGTFATGRALTVANGTWIPAPTAFTYEWYRDGILLPDATGSTYTLAPEDANTTIWVEVTGSRLGYEELTKNSAQVTTPKFFTTAPTPTISGTLRSGYTLTAKAGTWSPSATLTYQWYRSGSKISGATKSTYKLTTSDRGKKITVVVTGKKTGYGTVPMTSAAKTIYYEFSKAPTPTISGTLKSGHTIAVKVGTWSPTPTKTYQWYRNGKAIPGATKSTYKLTSSDKGKKITVKVTGKRTGYLTVTKTSASKTVAK
jgi:hypothetical protein